MKLSSVDLALVELAQKAGAAILAVRARSLASVEKADGSPVTEADRQAEAIILAGLPALWPGVPVVAEEAVSSGILPQIGRRFILVDALDGTREFIAGRSEFTVNVGLVEDGRPIMGIVHAPATGDFFLAVERGGAFAARGIPAGTVPLQADFQPIVVRPMQQPPVTLVSLSHFDSRTQAHLASRTSGEVLNIGSSIKFCLIAAGQADLYPRYAPTREWDTAAGDAILRAAGGSMVQPDGSPFVYGKADQGFENGPFVASGGKAAC